jgi:peptidoglycan/xylan/chitin deacetylase (PgdA/CDA1 family)
MRIPYQFIAMACAIICATPCLSTPVYRSTLPRQAPQQNVDHGSNRGVGHGSGLGSNHATGHDAEHVFDHAVTTEKLVALTFDADMTAKMRDELKSGKVASWYNANVIAVLQRENVPATLFLTGLWIEAYPEITKQLSQNPLFELGNHSYSHGGFRSPCYGLPAVKKSNEAAEVERTDALLQKYAVAYKKYFRFPGLCFDADDVKRVDAEDYTVINGDVEGGDGFEKYAAPIVANVVDHVRPGSIVVLHMHGGPNAPETAIALPDIIRKLRAQGYSFVKVSDLLKLQ